MTRIAHTTLDSETGYACVIHAGRHELTADESTAHGGTDTGPAPYQLLLSALAACTAITLRMVAARKGWELGSIHVDVELHKDEGADPHRASHHAERPARRSAEGDARRHRREDSRHEDDQGRSAHRNEIPVGRTPAAAFAPARQTGPGLPSVRRRFAATRRGESACGARTPWRFAGRIRAAAPSAPGTRPRAARPRRARSAR